MAAPQATEPESGLRLRLRVRGAVQGVGFRPFAYGVARRLSLGGFVRNDSEGVLIEVEGRNATQFVAALRADAPPLARIDAVDVQDVSPLGTEQFEIEASAGGAVLTRIPPDAATCEECLDDLFEPRGRFFRYPFVNCTHCGPRFTLTRSLPYDRAQTSMAKFAMCAACAAEYADPTNRRFHAEPIACPNCGPRLSHSIADIVAALCAGKIVALKGVGGYHLMCDARNAASVAELRRRKARDAKPFALMVANAASAALYVRPSATELALAQTPAHPIVLMRSRHNLPQAIAPGLARIGIMLAYAPLHHLLFAETAPHSSRESANAFALVATSANPGGEPLITDDVEAHARLRGIADLIVSHDREIVVRADDSVVQILDGAPAFIRRARGYTPEPIDLGADGPCVLACGGHLKATVTVTRGREAFVAQHAGDLSDAETLRFYRETIAHMSRLLDVAPEAVACDRHPDYLSTRYAEKSRLPLVPVQHHVAHVAAVAAEHGIAGTILGVALDGHGHGADGGAWGGELLRVDGAQWSRVGHLAPLALIGGDRAAREPWRMALAACVATGRLDAAADRFRVRPHAATLLGMARDQHAWSPTTSLGRLFDAAAGLLLLDARQDYEGQAAMQLEALVETPRTLENGWRIEDGVLDFSPLLAFLIDEAPDARAGAEWFHGTLAAGLAAWIVADPAAIDGARIALGGGCMMNRILAEDLSGRLRAKGFDVLHARAVPANDGGLSLGQAAVARAAFAAN